MENNEMNYVISLLKDNHTITNFALKKEKNDTSSFQLNKFISFENSLFKLPNINNLNSFPQIIKSNIPMHCQKPKFNLQYNKFKDISKQLILKQEIKQSIDHSSSSTDSRNNLIINTKLRYLNFRPYIDIPLLKQQENLNEKYYYKMIGNDCYLIKNLLEDNGFLPCGNNSNEWTILWSSGHINLKLYFTLNKYQKVNHFPRSNELTRKDLLYKNISKLISSFPNSRLNFLPMSFLLPNEISFLEDEINKNNSLWIIKPVASSQGRGIFLTNTTHDIPNGQTLIASKYIINPFLINGFKFDLRIYVFLTSIYPLRLYRYREGLVRFASDKYSDNINDRCSHLTNYAVNKGNKNYIQNNDPDTDFKSSKWNLSGFREYLESNHINSEVIFNKIDDIIIKTFIGVENTLYKSFKKYCSHTNTCFELFGFDILIDDLLNPWLIEVNLSPNLHYDALIDLKIKGEMLAECFDLMRIVPYDLRKPNSSNLPFYTNDFQSIKDLKYIKITKEYKELIWDTNQEMNRTKEFKRLMPSANYFDYRKYFDEEKEINIILGIIESEKNKNKTNTMFY